MANISEGWNAIKCQFVCIKALFLGRLCPPWLETAVINRYTCIRYIRPGECVQLGDGKLGQFEYLTWEYHQNNINVRPSEPFQTAIGVDIEINFLYQYCKLFSNRYKKLGLLTSPSCNLSVFGVTTQQVDSKNKNLQPGFSTPQHLPYYHLVYCLSYHLSWCIHHTRQVYREISMSVSASVS